MAGLFIGFWLRNAPLVKVIGNPISDGIVFKNELTHYILLSLFQAPRESSPLNWETANKKIKWEETGEIAGGGACNHFFKRPVPVYQLLVYPLIGQIWQVISTLPKRVVPVTQKDGVRRPRAWNRGIHDNFCVERIITRFPAHRSAEEGTEDLPCELGAWKRYFCNPAHRLRSCLITK